MRRTPRSAQHADERHEVRVVRVDDRERIGVVQRRDCTARSARYDRPRSARHDLFDQAGLLDARGDAPHAGVARDELARNRRRRRRSPKRRGRGAPARGASRRSHPRRALRSAAASLFASCFLTVLGGRRRFGRRRRGLGRFAGAAGVCRCCRRLGVSGQRRRRTACATLLGMKMSGQRSLAEWWVSRTRALRGVPTSHR